MYTVITGATSGIGEAMAYEVAKAGRNIILVGRNINKLKDLQSFIKTRYNVKVQACVVDMAQIQQIEAFSKWINEKNILIDIIINNAGIGDFGNFFESDIDKQIAMIDINIKGLTYLTHSIRRSLQSGGKIMQVASTAAFAPGPYMSVYYASKAYVLSFSRAIGYELKKEGIKVSILCPGPTKTPFIEKANMKKSSLAQISSMSPEKVAQIAYKELQKGKEIIIPGMINKISVGAMTLLPTSIATQLVACTQKKP